MRVVTQQVLRLLVSDDSDYVREHLITMLSALPQVEVVGEAENVENTKRAVQTLAPDVLVLDIHMPDGNGLDVLTYVKRNNPGTIVIMLTNHANTFYRQACLRTGADYFFDKSTEFDRVVDVLESLSD